MTKLDYASLEGRMMAELSKDEPGVMRSHTLPKIRDLPQMQRFMTNTAPTNNTGDSGTVTGRLLRK